MEGSLRGRWLETMVATAVVSLGRPSERMISCARRLLFALFGVQGLRGLSETCVADASLAAWERMAPVCGEAIGAVDAGIEF